MTEELDYDDDAAIDAIVDHAEEAALHALTPTRGINPHPAGSSAARVWDHAFNNAYYREHYSHD